MKRRNNARYQDLYGNDPAVPYARVSTIIQRVAVLLYRNTYGLLNIFLIAHTFF